MHVTRGELFKQTGFSLIKNSGPPKTCLVHLPWRCVRSCGVCL